MGETLGQPFELQVTTALAEQMLGRPLQLDPSIQPGVYNERYATYHRVEARAKQVFETSLARAAEFQIPVTAEAVETFPDPVTLESLRYSLSRERKRIGMLDGLDTFVANIDEDERITGTKLRPNQLDAVHKFHKFMNDVPPASWQTTGKAGAIVRPTGSGKTGTFAKLAAALKSGETEDEPVRVLVLVPTQTILKQTMGREGKRGFGRFAPGLEVGAYYEDEQNFRDVTVMTTASFNELMKNQVLPNFDAVIVDECDLGYEGTTGDNLRKYCSDKVLIGLTATPEQSAQKNIYSLYEHEIATMDLRDGVQDGILAPVRAQALLVEPDWEKIELPDDQTERRRAKRKLRLEKWLDDIEHRIINETIPRGVGAVVHMPAGENIKVARDFALRLRKKMAMGPVRAGGPNVLGIENAPRFIRAMEIGGKAQRTVEGKEIKEAGLSLFDARQLDALTFVSGLRRGWDSAWGYDLYDADPTRSPTSIIQILGRILRMLENADGSLLLGPDNKPIMANAYSYIDPDMVGQYTVCDALNLKSGETLEHMPFEKRSAKRTPGPKAPQDQEADAGEAEEAPAAAIVITATGEVAVVETVELEHGAEETGPEHEGDDEILGYTEAAARSGLPHTVFRKLWTERGLAIDDLIFATELAGDLEALWSEQPYFRPRPLPEAGFVTVDSVFGQLSRRDWRNSTVLRQLAAREGFAVHRFIHEGRVDFYFAAQHEAAIIARFRKEQK